MKVEVSMKYLSVISNLETGKAESGRLKRKICIQEVEPGFWKEWGGRAFQVCNMTRRWQRESQTD
jgi:hypothetical protein